MQQTAILMMNLGSPDSPTASGLKPYLSEFLMDERVIDLPLIARTLLVKGIIVPFRRYASAKKYQSIWTVQGSPLLVHSFALQKKVQERLKEPVYLSMRYGNPSTRSVLEQIRRDNPSLQRLIVLPLYPHYAMSSYETAVVQVKELYAAMQWPVELKIIPPYYNEEPYIQALSGSIHAYLQENYDHILFSYHGIPERHLRKTDCTGMHCLQVKDCCNVPSKAHAVCYRHQVISTTEAVAQKLKLDPKKYSFSFQSRLGRDAWLKPYTAAQLSSFPAMGIKKLLVVCPAFVSDCLETLEEINEEGKEDFMKSGGESFTMIPALNETDAWIDCVEWLLEREKAATPA